MPKFWMIKGLKNGSPTTKFPRQIPTRDEIPLSNIPPEPGQESDWGEGKKVCPTGAIDTKNKKIIMNRCIYCAKCADAGFVFDRNDEKISQALNAVANSKIYSEERAKIFKKSLHVFIIDSGSCNACNLEALNMANPFYDVSRLGITFTNSPKHADALLVLGAPNRSMVEYIVTTYESMPEPKVVIAAGACALSGGVFANSPNFVSPVEEIIPVDIFIPGCPPSPIQFIQGLLLAMGRKR
ncbi:MAG: NADH-quinone oxidoreductase subunit NuoB [Conexivisphaerales archaeon]